MVETIVECRAVNPTSFVYVQVIDPSGLQRYYKLIYAHDDAHRAALEALAYLGQLEESGNRIRSVDVFTDPPRVFRPEPVVRRTLDVRELQ